MVPSLIHSSRRYLGKPKNSTHKQLHQCGSSFLVEKSKLGEKSVTEGQAHSSKILVDIVLGHWLPHRRERGG